MFLLIIGCVILYNAISFGESANAVTVAAAFIFGVLSVCFSVFFDKFSVMRALKLPSVKAPRSYEFLDDCVLCRISLNGIEGEERYAYSIMEKYFGQNNAVYIRINLDNCQRFLAVHNDTYSDGSAEELKALLESRGVHK